MNSIVIELQRNSVDPQILVEELLRKAYIVCKKLDIPNIEQWISSELNGYIEGAEIPEYRIVHGIVKAFNKYHGWITVSFPDEESQTQISTARIGQPICELSALSKQNELCAELPVSFKQDLAKTNGVYVEAKLFISPTSIIKILDTVRNEILKWSLELEKNSIMGEGYSFSEIEKRKATTIKYTIVNNIQSMNNSMLQQASDNCVQEYATNREKINELLLKIEEYITLEKLPEDNKKQLLADKDTLAIQIQSPKPNDSIINESVKSIRNILEGATGSIAATGLLELIKMIAR